jgi:hypothetical protein
MAGYKRKRAVRRRPRRRVRAKTTVDKRQQRQINKLLKNQYRWAQYKYSGSQLDAPSAAGTPVIVPQSWTTLFASNNRSNSTDRAFLQKIRFNFNVTVASSGLLTVNPMHYSIFLVSVRKEFVLQTYARTGPNLGTLTENYDYMTHTLGSTVGTAQWQLNPTIYKVHARRQGMVGNFATEGPLTAPEEDETAAKVSNIRDANRNHTIMLPYNRKLQRGIGQTISPAQQLEWKDMTVNDINGHDQLFIVFFNNATDTQSVSFHWSAQVMLKTPQ